MICICSPGNCQNNCSLCNYQNYLRHVFCSCAFGKLIFVVIVLADLKVAESYCVRWIFFWKYVNMINSTDFLFAYYVLTWGLQFNSIQFNWCLRACLAFRTYQMWNQSWFWDKELSFHDLSENHWNQISWAIKAYQWRGNVRLIKVLYRSLSSLSSCSDGDEEAHAFRTNGTVYPTGG